MFAMFVFTVTMCAKCLFPRVPCLFPLFVKFAMCSMCFAMLATQVFGTFAKFAVLCCYVCLPLATFVLFLFCCARVSTAR